MKKRALLISVLLIMITFVRAAYFENLPYTITQPDGKIINCFVSGDEFFNWLHDQDGYTIIQAPDGYYYYAEQDGDLVKPSKYLVNSILPGNKGLSKWVKISQKEYQRRRDTMFEFEKKAKGGPVYAPRTGTMNNLVIFIRFSDDGEFSATRQTFDDKLNPITGVSLKSYYNEVSYGNLTINSSLYPVCAPTTNLSYNDFHARSYFQPYNATTNTNGYSTDAERTTREHTLLANAVTWINSNSPISASLNLDGDGDNNVDNICFIIRGNNGAWNDLLWAHRWSLYSQVVTINGKRVYDYNFEPEAQIAVTTLCHEMFHSLGAPDLYHYTNQGVISPAGRWDIMDGGSGHMLAYMKWKYTQNSWITSIPQITSGGTYTLNPLTSPTNNCYRIGSPNSSTQFFVIEYRNRTGNFETNVPGSGLIVYRIDPSVSGNSNGPPDEVYVYRPGGTTILNGTPNNAFYSSTAGRTAINDGTNPTGFLQNGTSGGLNISNVTAAGTTISFTVNFPSPPDFPVVNGATSISQTSFVANWAASVSATGYKIDVSTDPGFISTIIGYNNLDLGNVTSSIVSGLSPKTLYYYRIRAYNMGGSSSNSGTVSLKTLSTPSTVPLNLTSLSCNDLVTLKWQKSAGADFKRYNIYMGASDIPTAVIDSAINGISDTSKVIHGLLRGKTYNFSVTSVNTDAVQSSSSTASQTIVKTGVIPRIKSKWNDVLICYNQGDSLKSYQWYKDASLIPGSISQYYQTNKVPGNYSVTAIDKDGCKNVSLSKAMPSPTSGLKSLTVFPNPASANVTLRIYGEAEGKTVFRIYNSRGIKVTEFQTLKTGPELLKEIQVSALPYGIYQVQVSVNDEDFYSSQIVVIK